MTLEERLKLREQRQRETRDDALDQLSKFGRCAIFRPTGFGKTYVMCQIAANKRYKKVLYLYPSETVRNEAEKNFKSMNVSTETGGKVTFMTYIWLSRRRKSAKEVAYNIRKLGYELIVCDELHHMGADKAGDTLEVICNNLDCKSVHLVGGTATPLRMDSVDCVERFFGNHMAGFYNLDSAIDDGLLLAPRYVYAPASVDIALKDDIAQLNRLKKRNASKELIAIRERELRKKRDMAVKIMNAPSLIRRHVDEVYGWPLPRYMLFVAFFVTIEAMEKMEEDIKAWFQVAFDSKYEVRITKVASTAKYKDNVNEVAKFQPVTNRIDVVLSVNMMNEGYHLNTVTGVIMVRPTQSSAILLQQMGRGLSVGQEKPAIILDLVDNIHTKALYRQTADEVVQAALNTKPGEAVSDIARCMALMSWINPKKIHVIDKVAELESITGRADYRLSETDHQRILKLRDRNHRVGDIAARMGIPYWLVMRTLVEHRDELIRRGKYLTPSDNLEYAARKHGDGQDSESAGTSSRARTRIELTGGVLEQYQQYKNKYEQEVAKSAYMAYTAISEKPRMGRPTGTSKSTLGRMA